jgi:hypothetical protein
MNMNYKIFAITIIGFLSACTSDYPVQRIDEFTLETGGYMRTVLPYPVVSSNTSSNTFNVKASDLNGSKWELLAEAVTPNFGDNFASYEMVVRFVDATAANGSNSVADKTFKTYQASAFTKDPQTSYPRATIGSTGRELITAVGLPDNQVAAGDRFEVRATMVLKDGKRFNIANTGANIASNGNFYSSPFLYRVNVVQ